MSADLKKVEAEALLLSPEQRAQLADTPWQSEIERRVREVDDGTVRTIAHEDVIAELLRARYGK